MATKSVSVGLTEVTLLEANDKRSAFMLANPDATAVLYFSDEEGRGLKGMPLFPQSYIMISRNEGAEVEKKFWIISDTAGKTVSIMEFFQKTNGDIQQPNKRDPYY